MEESEDKRNIYLVKYNGRETGVLAENIVDALIQGLALTETKNITCVKLVYTEEEARSK